MGNLPKARTGFVGRNRETMRVARLLGSHRLVTVTGPAGMGKTRLSLEVARRLADDFADGVWVVELGAISDPTVVAQAVASALGAVETPRSNSADLVVSHLRRSEVLLLVDNCEHLPEACRALIEQVSAACPGVSVLATSQQALGIEAEAVFVLGPMSLPDQEAMIGSDAYTLFVERAGAARLEPIDAEAVAEICRRLDGLPLAIELAAAQTGSMSALDIANHLDRRFGLLVNEGGLGHDNAARHRSLQAALDWSYELLDAQQQALLRQLSVFAGGATLASIDAVAAGDRLSGESVVPILESLVARSLVVIDSSDTGSRHRLLETIRLFAGERLSDSDEAHAARDRHGKWFASLAEEAEPHLTGAEQQHWMQVLESDLDNLRTALRWALDSGQQELGLRLAGSLTLFWRVRGHLREGLDWFDRVLAPSGPGDSNGSAVSPSIRAKALWGAGFLRHMLQDHAGAVPFLREAAGYQRRSGDRGAEARSLLILADCTSALSGPAASLAPLDQSAVLARAAGDNWCLAHALSTSAAIRDHLGETAAAGPMHEEALKVARESGDVQSQGFCTNSFGLFALNQGDYSMAEDLLTEAMGLANSTGEIDGVSVVLGSLGQVAMGRGDYAAAGARLREALELVERLPGPYVDVAAPLVFLGRLSLAVGDVTEAAAHLTRAEEAMKQTGRSHPLLAEGLGAVARARGDDRQARMLLDHAVLTARAGGNLRHLSKVLHSSAALARAEGNHDQAISRHYEALALRERIGDKPGMVESLEAVAGLGVDAGRLEYAVRLFGAAESSRSAHRYARHPVDTDGYEVDIAELRRRCDAESLDQWWSQGRRLTLDAAVAYAARGRDRRDPEAVGWDSLTAAEAEVAALAGQGLSNAEIAEQLLMSFNTVKAHLKKVFQKLELGSRRELRELAAGR